MGAWTITGNVLSINGQGTLGTQGGNFALVVETSGQEHLRVDAIGNVGIGTSAPASPLDVRSSARIASLYSTTNGNQWVEVGNTVTHMNLGVGASGPTAGVPYLWSASNNLMFGNDGGPTLFIQEMGNGKVGINTVTPAVTLDVGGGLIHVGGNVAPTTPAQGAYLGWNALTGGTGETDFINNQGLGTGGFAFMNTPASGTPRTTLMVITGGGQVGIGTASPRSALEVDVVAPSALGPTLTLTNTGGGANAAVSIDLNASIPSASGAYNPFARIEALPDPNSTSDIVFLTNNPSVPNNGLVERMRITCAPQTAAHPTGSPWPITQSRVGIGTASPAAQLSVCGTGGENVGTAFSTTLRTSSGALGALGAPNDDLALASFCCSVDNLNGLSLGIRAVRTAASPTGWPSTAISLGMDVDNTVRAGAALFLHASGNVGMGINTPTSKLHVAGDIAVTGDVLLTGADCAEDFDVAGDEPPEPGTVLVIDESGALRESQQAYDQKVVGVVSGADAYRHALVLDRRSGEERRIPVALMGKVYCKVDAQYSPIEVGDLLTTSPTPGHAMKAVEPAKAFGSVMGKALRPLKRGCGLIPILISLQ